MPHFIVWQLEPRDRKKIDELSDMIEKRASMVSELQLTPEDVSLSFPNDDSVKNGSGFPIIVIGELLFDKPERTPQARQQLAEIIKHCFEKTLDLKGRKLEVAVKKFNVEKDGFAAGNY